MTVDELIVALRVAVTNDPSVASMTVSLEGCDCIGDCVGMRKLVDGRVDVFLLSRTDGVADWHLWKGPLENTVGREPVITDEARERMSVSNASEDT